MPVPGHWVNLDTMNRYLFILALPLFFITCTKSRDVPPKQLIVGQWSLNARQDISGNWTPYTPTTPEQIIFRADGTVDYLDADGKPHHSCCQPTRYMYKEFVCPPNAYCVYRAGTIEFADILTCPAVRCAGPPSWQVKNVDTLYLDVNSTGGNLSVIGLRYQRVR